MSPPPENPPADPASTHEPTCAGTNEYSRSERNALLRVARAAILAQLEDCPLSLNPPAPHLAEPRGAFTTLHLHGQLRGCVGYVFPVSPLYRTVAETAVAAAFEDTRFDPVTRQEAPDLEIEISVLSLLAEIRAEDIEVGRHGLLVTSGTRRGLLLPQVPVEHGWDRITFLEQTCHKADLPFDAWQRSAKLEAFTAEVFSDREMREPG
jgi:AmmeMemoRadiSam system protein A